jgi:hypothetical protein
MGIKTPRSSQFLGFLLQTVAASFLSPLSHILEGIFKIVCGNFKLGTPLDSPSHGVKPHVFN